MWTFVLKTCCGPIIFVCRERALRRSDEQSSIEMSCPRASLLLAFLSFLVHFKLILGAFYTRNNGYCCVCTSMRAAGILPSLQSLHNLSDFIHTPLQKKEFRNSSHACVNYLTFPGQRDTEPLTATCGSVWKACNTKGKRGVPRTAVAYYFVRALACEGKGPNLEGRSPLPRRSTRTPGR